MASSSGCTSARRTGAAATASGCSGHLTDHARDNGITLVRLETGIDQVQAIGLYESMGFRRCAPFGPYRDDPLSPCYELRLPPD